MGENKPGWTRDVFLVDSGGGDQAFSGSDDGHLDTLGGISRDEEARHIGAAFGIAIDTEPLHPTAEALGERRMLGLVRGEEEGVTGDPPQWMKGQTKVFLN